MEGTIAIILRTIVAVRLELHDTASIHADRDANKSCVCLPIPLAEAVAITILNLAGVRVTHEVSLAVEFAGAVPAVALDSELAAIAGVVTGGVVVRSALVVDSLALVIDDREACVMATLTTAGRTGDRGKVTGGPEDFQVFCGNGCRGDHEA